jgi:hypothetical protein
MPSTWVPEPLRAAVERVREDVRAMLEMGLSPTPAALGGTPLPSRKLTGMGFGSIILAPEFRKGIAGSNPLAAPSHTQRISRPVPARSRSPGKRSGYEQGLTRPQCRS